MKRWFYCTRCHQQTWVLNKEIDYLVHKPCKAMMTEMAWHANEVPHTNDFVAVYKEKTVNFGDGSLITCSTCGTKYSYPNVCCTYHNPEKTVKFEVGDKVSVTATVVSTEVSVIDHVKVRVAGASERITTVHIPVEQVTLIERPKKFEVGKKYKFGSRGSHTYMRLGDNQWFDYDRDTTIQDRDLDVYYLVELDS